MPLLLAWTELCCISFPWVSLLSLVRVVASCLLWDTRLHLLSLARVAIVVLVRRTLVVLLAARADPVALRILFVLLVVYVVGVSIVASISVSV